MTMLPASVSVAGMDAADVDVLRALLVQWAAKVSRNQTRMGYYNGKNRLKDLGISIPPSLKSIEAVVGWPAKAVDMLQQRVRFDRFVAPGQDDPFDLSLLLAQNQFQAELPQAIRSSLIHSVAFLTTTQGDVQSGEPEVVTSFRSALHGTGLWDARRRELSAALSVVDVDDSGRPTYMVLYLPDRVAVIQRTGRGFVAEWRRHFLGRVPVEPLVFRPDLDRVFGRSRINRAVMSITDEAVRTVVRTEVSAEFYAAPQRYILGASEEAFGDVPAWEALLGRVLGIGRDEDGEVPVVGQFAQQSMQPHTEMLRSEATRFAGETGIPVGSLGVVQDNPSSAESIHAVREDLIIEAENAQDVYRPALVRAMQNAVMLRDGLSEVSPEMARLDALFRRADRPSRTASADAVIKQVAAVPWLAESSVVLEELGFDSAQITRLLSDKRRQAASSGVLDRLLAGQAVTGDDAG